MISLLVSALVLINGGWSFHLGDAASMQRDFDHGTQYFSHMAKASAWSGVDPTSLEFVEDSTWMAVTLPHDWAVDLPFSSEASHSHGYKCIGWKYPENSVGWYRRELYFGEEDRGKTFTVEFEGIYRDRAFSALGQYLVEEHCVLELGVFAQNQRGVELPGLFLEEFRE